MLFKKRDAFQESMKWYNGLDYYEKDIVDNMLERIDEHNNGLYFEDKGIDYVFSECENLGRAVGRINDDKRKGKKFGKDFENFVFSLYTYAPFNNSLLIKKEAEKKLAKTHSYVKYILFKDFVINNTVTLNVSGLSLFEKVNPILPEKKLYIFPTWDEQENNVTFIISGTQQEILSKENIYTFSVKENAVMTYNPSRDSRYSVYLENETGSFIANVLRSGTKKVPIYILTRKRTEQVKQFFNKKENKEKPLTK